MRFLRARRLRSPQVWWRTSAAFATGAAVLAATSGWGAVGAVLAVWALVSLYGSVDHVVEPVLAELAAGLPAPAPPAPWASVLDRTRPPAELSSRQRRVLRLMAYGLADAEIAELMEADEAVVVSDVAVILAHLGAADRADAIEITLCTGIVAAAGPRGARPAA